MPARRRLHLRGGARRDARRLRQDNHYVAPPPPKVTVALPVQQKVTRYLEATGNAAAVNTANLVARVQGFLQEINYKDGEQVKQAQTLFTIEPEPYKLKLEQAQAAEAGAQATVKQTEADYERQTDLVEPPGLHQGRARQCHGQQGYGARPS